MTRGIGERVGGGGGGGEGEEKGGVDRNIAVNSCHPLSE